MSWLDKIIFNGSQIGDGFVAVDTTAADVTLTSDQYKNRRIAITSTGLGHKVIFPFVRGIGVWIVSVSTSASICTMDFGATEVTVGNGTWLVTCTDSTVEFFALSGGTEVFASSDADISVNSSFAVALIVITGAQTANRNYTVPWLSASSPKVLVLNKTSGGHNTIFKSSAGGDTGVSVSPGQLRSLAWYSSQTYAVS